MNYKNYINGKWVKTGKTFASTNPATGELVGKCCEAGPREVAMAVKSARKAFAGWRLTPAPKRAEYLLRLGQLFEQRKNELSRIVTQEMGKVLKEGAGDVQESIDITYYMAGEGRRLFGHNVPSELANKFAMAVREPVGVCALITPWNFPTAIPCWKMMPALVLGNTVVLKPASDTSVSAAKVIQLMDEVGFPPGVVNFVMGPGEKTGNVLIKDPDVDLISFTGSTVVGRKIATTATSLGKRVSLEMGGKNAIIVMDDGDLDLATDAILWAAFGTTGQRCTACSRVLVHHRVKSKLVSKLLERAKKLRLGDGLNPKTDVGPVINAGQLARIHRYVKIGQREGAKLLCGGRIRSDGAYKKGYFYEPTIFDNVKPKMCIAQEEIFGPVVALISVKDLDEAIRVNNDTAYGLSSSIFTRDVNKAYRAMRDITTGIVYVNAGTTGAEVQLPFGGTRGTGNGHREAGQAAIDSFSEWKTIYVDYSGKVQRAQIDNYEA